LTKEVEISNNLIEASHQEILNFLGTFLTITVTHVSAKEGREGERWREREREWEEGREWEGEKKSERKKETDGECVKRAPQHSPKRLFV
jgi:hypothetical protein